MLLDLNFFKKKDLRYLAFKYIVLSLKLDNIQVQASMQVRWNFKLLPNQQQEVTLEDWLVTLRKHRNYALRERRDGFETNNQDANAQVIYAYGSYCDLDSKIEYGSCCPLTSHIGSPLSISSIAKLKYDCYLKPR